MSLRDSRRLCPLYPRHPALGSRESEDTGWTNEQLAVQYRTEIRQRFEAENAAHRAEDLADVAIVQNAHPKEWAALVAREPCFGHAPDSVAWQVYEKTDIQIESNNVRIVFPSGWEITPDLIRMFDDASVAWTRPTANAEIVGGAACIVLSLILVDYWDDELASGFRTLFREWTPA